MSAAGDGERGPEEGDVSGCLSVMLGDYADLEGAKFTSWEQDFISNMQEKLILAEEELLSDAETFTEKQQAKILELYRKYKVWLDR